jgi:dGTPase
MEFDWERLISDRRYTAKPKTESPKKVYPADEFRSQFESDYDRVTYSKAFRRLGKKTQVHPMEMNAHIHNRLTHSLEVASVGRSFARRLSHFLHKQGLLPCRCSNQCQSAKRQCNQTTSDLTYSLMAACLVHDIGNPPFGHAGEYSIREWSQRHVSEVFPEGMDLGAVPDGLKSDVHVFEGNAQGFRLAARADIPSAGHIRVTHTTLGAMVKYPWDSSDPRAKQKGKFNFFSSERAVAETVFGQMGLWDGESFYRHPMSFLSEAADDICYRVIDIEDAVEMNILSADRATELYVMLLGKSATPKHRGMHLSQLRAAVVGHLIDQLWSVFKSDFAAIMSGQREHDLKAGVSATLNSALAEVKETNRKIYSTEKKVRVEIGAYKILGSILKALCKAAQAYSQHQNLAHVPFIARRCLELAWPVPYLQENSYQPYSWWIHEILDYISGLTDDHACMVANAIEGVSQN